MQASQKAGNEAQNRTISEKKDERTHILIWTGMGTKKDGKKEATSRDRYCGDRLEVCDKT
jgi:hypothetical protein